MAVSGATFFLCRHVDSVTEAYQVHCPLVVIAPAVNTSHHGAYHSPASGAEVCNAYGFTSVPTVGITIDASIICDIEERFLYLLSKYVEKVCRLNLEGRVTLFSLRWRFFNPYPTAFPYGNGMVLHFYQQQESSTTKTVHKVVSKGLKTYV